MNKYDFSKYAKQVEEINCMCDKLLNKRKIRKIYNRILDEKKNNTYKLGYNEIDKKSYKNTNNILLFDKIVSISTKSFKKSSTLDSCSETYKKSYS